MNPTFMRMMDLKNTFATQSWKSVQVPHNWDQYDGYRRLTHGNKHGYAWYRKSFTVNSSHKNKRYFLYFEGVGSYATVWLNGKLLGTHAGGRTTFQLDATNYILLNNQENILAVRADHPAEIQDLPWVCGGCSTERGFSEGSQPMGIFRPVHLLITEPIRIAPFGIHIWNDTTITTQKAQLYGSVEIQNLSTKKSSIKIVHELRNQDNQLIVSSNNIHSLSAKTTQNIPISLPSITNPKLWSPEQPYLYQMVTKIYENGKLLDIQQTSYGIRSIKWLKKPNGQKQLLVNGKPFFINGIAEYEHLLGNSHAFSAEQIKTRVEMVKAAGFNAFRDAHQPHNLRYQDYWDKDGIYGGHKWQHIFGMIRQRFDKILRLY
jgi:beta-galactosidase/beta-glucuronidase